MVLQCTRSCGGGIQYRSVKCVGGDACLLASEPQNNRECNNHPCPTEPPLAALPVTDNSPYEWLPMDWSKVNIFYRDKLSPVVFPVCC